MAFVRRAVEGVTVDVAVLGPVRFCPGAYWVVLGPDVELRETQYDHEAAAERYRASGIPKVEEFDVEALLQPITRAEIIADAEERVFAG